jgi:hypothetical protein
MKWQYLILALIFLGAAVIALWTATHVNMVDIEETLSSPTTSSGANSSRANSSPEPIFFLNESIVEGGHILLYLGIVVALFVIAIGSTVYVSRRR